MNNQSNIDALHPPLRQTHVMPPCLSHGSLFSGIGGFDLAAQWMGWNNIFQVEKDEWCRKVLAKNFPKTERFADIKDFTGHEYTNRIDVISGGFPCQPFSTAGLQKGEKDERFLWHEMLRVITEIKPTWVVCENVVGLLSIENGKTIQSIHNDLESEGYWVEMFVIPAFSIGAWHKRERLWIVANSNSSGLLKQDIICEQQGRADVFWASKIGKAVCWEELEAIGNNTEQRGAKEPISKPFICGGNNGISDGMDRLKGLGNAIVPQVAYEIFSAIGAVSQHGA